MTIPLPTLTIPRVVATFPIDGSLDKAPWSALAPIALRPSHGRSSPAEPAFQPTALRVCRDDAHLFVAFHCADRDIRGSYQGRNQPIYEEEVVEAFLAPGSDPRRYFELESSPRDAWFEAAIESPDGRRASMRVDRDWVCAGWRRAVRLERPGGRDLAWSVEWAIPFTGLGAAAPAPGARWRANFFRIDQAGGGEYSAWSPTLADPPDFHVPDRFGVLVFA